MALQSSGAISISQIKTELSSSSNSLRDLSAAAGFSTPDAMSEFYGYSAYTPPPSHYFDSYFTISAEATSPNNATKNYNMFFGDWYIHPEFIVFPWRGDYWSFDISEIDTTYQQSRYLPEEGYLYSTLSCAFSDDIGGDFFEFQGGNPSAFYFSWYDTYADDGMISYTFDINYYYGYGMPIVNGSNETALVISYYSPL